MVDFSCAQPGYCNLPTEDYAFIPGVRVNCVSGQRGEVKVYYRVDQDDELFILVFLDGETEVQAYWINDYFVRMVNCCDDYPVWYLCAGTDDPDDKLTVKRVDIERIVDTFLAYHPHALTEAGRA